MTKDNLKSTINKYVGYAEQEIYDALEEIYTKEEVIKLMEKSIDKGIQLNKDLKVIHKKDHIDKWIKQNL